MACYMAHHGISGENGGEAVPVWRLVLGRRGQWLLYLSGRACIHRASVFGPAFVVSAIDFYIIRSAIIGEGGFDMAFTWHSHLGCCEAVVAVVDSSFECVPS